MNLKRSFSLSVIGPVALAFGVAAALAAPAAASSDVVISQVYGGGGNSGATYTNDFIELFNRGAAPVSLSGWSVQYASATGSSWAVTNLSGMLAPGQYYLVQEAAGSGGSVALPTPDAIGAIAMSATNGKVALVSSTTPLAGACPVSGGAPGLIDFVGFGSTASCFEGAGPTATLSNPTAALRGSNGCTDTDSNGADFATGAPTPRNTASPASPCGGGPTNPAIVATGANPGSVPAGGVTLLTATVLPGTNPTSTSLTVSADLTMIGGAASQLLLDDGSGGDATAGDGVFSFTAPVAAATPAGSLSLPVVATDAQSRSASSSIALVVTGAAPPPLVVISQVYGGGGNSGAFYRNDFVELFNRDDVTVSLEGWAVQYTSASGTSWQVTPLTGTLAPGRHYLVQEGSGTGGSADLPMPDALGTILMGATGGKLALTSTVTPLTGSCPLGVSGLIDLVGVGSANCFEGSAAASATSNTTATLRNGAGCIDTNDNAADFLTGAPTPRNTSAAFTDCSAPPAPPIAIAAIQGGGSTSPLAGQPVTTRGIVTARRSNGFFLQTPDSSVDGDPATSEGIFVFTSAAPPASATVGNELLVSGSVQEFRPSADLGSPPVTEIVGPSLSLLSTGNTLPAAIALGPADLDPASSIENLERYEGMRVSVASLTVVGPTQGNVNEASATSNSNGVFYGVVTGTPRPFREPGVQVPDPLPAGAPCCVPRFDANPERLRVDSDGQPGAPRIDVAAGAQVDGLVGVLDYGFRTYTLLPDPLAPVTISGNPGVTPVPAPGPEQFSIAAFNMERFFDTASDGTGEPVLTADAFATRLAKASLLIRGVMGTPDILGVEEVENLSTLQSVAARLNADAVAAGDPDPAYVAYLAEGNDPGGIDSGFLVKSAKVEVVEVTQVGKNTTYINPNTGQPDLLNDRPPLVLRARIERPLGPAFPVTVIVNHLRSLNGVDDPVDGRVRAKRLAQAEFLADLIQARQDADPAEHIVSVGDYNAFQFSDGFVDVIGIVKGTPASPDEVVLASAAAHPVDPNLVDLANTLPAVQRYSYNFDGNAQSLDHVLVSQNLLPRLAGFHYGRVDSDFPEVYRNDATRPERLSDHDPLVAIFDFPPNTPPSAAAGPDQSVVADAAGQATVQLQGSASDADGDALTATWTGPFGTVSGLQPSVTLALGTHVLTLQVDDGRGGIATDSVTIEVRDETAPAIASVTPSLTLLWPPNGRLVPVSLTVDATDASGAPSCSVTGVTSNELIQGPDAGWRADWRITGDLSLLLRAERRSRSGRLYTIEVSCTDAAGNAAATTTSVLVPHDQRDHHDGDGCERNEHGRGRDDRGRDDHGRNDRDRR